MIVTAMTLNKYIRRLADKLDPQKQREKRKVKKNARLARPNLKGVELGCFPSNIAGRHGWLFFVTPQTSRYGVSFHDGRRKKGKKGANGRILPCAK